MRLRGVVRAPLLWVGLLWRREYHGRCDRLDRRNVLQMSFVELDCPRNVLALPAIAFMVGAGAMRFVRISRHTVYRRAVFV